MLDKKHGDRVTLFAGIERSQHEALRLLAFKERKSMASIVREALGLYLEKKTKASKKST